MLALDVLLISLGYVYVYRRQGHSLKAWTYSRNTASDLLRHSWPLAFSAFFVSLYMKIDQLMIDAYLGKVALGVYTPVVNLSEAWYFLPMAIVTALFPAIMQARKTDMQRYRLRLQQLYELMIVLGLLAAVTVTVLAPYLYAWFYKPEFAEGAGILVIHIWAGVFISLNLANGQYLIAEGHTRLLLWRSLVGAAVNIALNAWWIPLYGMAGAAFATVVAYASSAFFVIFVPKTREQGWIMLKSLTLVPLISRTYKTLLCRK
jgi:O-antigen/teichoic acid export membrane protein